MGFFDKIMASVGIGSAKVDTVLNSNVSKPGGVISGVVHVKGGNVDQDIEDIDVSLMVDVKIETEEGHYYSPELIAKHRVTGKFKIHKEENRQFPFEFTVPLEVPVTLLGSYKLGNIKLYVKTDLDIESALDKADKDYLSIEPLPNMNNFLNAVLNLGFVFNKADVEKGRIPGSHYNFYEEIEFYGHRSQFPKIKELEVTFIAQPNEVTVVLEMDKKGLFGSTEKYRIMSIPYDDSHYNYTAELQRLLSQV
jgi:sporulation-control protein